MVLCTQLTQQLYRTCHDNYAIWWDSVISLAMFIMNESILLFTVKNLRIERAFMLSNHERDGKLLKAVVCIVL